MSDFLQAWVEKSPRNRAMYERAKKRAAEVEAMYEELDKLRAENRRLRKALQELVDAYCARDERCPDTMERLRLAVRVARAELEGKG